MPFSSPTTTSAVNEKRRPPLTTLATRLIATTRSWRSRPLASIGWCLAIRVRVLDLEGQPAPTGSVGQSLHAAVVLVAAAVENARFDAGFLRSLREPFTSAPGLLHRLQVTQVGLDPAHRSDRAAAVVVDQLREQAPVRAEDRKAGPLGGAPDAAADPAAALIAPCALALQHLAHARLPTFRATYSPA